MKSEKQLRERLIAMETEAKVIREILGDVEIKAEPKAEAEIKADKPKKKNANYMSKDEFKSKLLEAFSQEDMTLKAVAIKLGRNDAVTSVGIKALEKDGKIEMKSKIGLAKVYGIKKGLF